MSDEIIERSPDHTMRMLVHGRLRLFVHTEEAPSDEAWRSVWSSDVWSSPHVVLVSTDGGAPTAKQRIMLKDSYDITATHTAVLTRSALTRGAATALSWLGMRIRAFAADDLDGAAEYLKLDADEHEVAGTQLVRMRLSLAGAPALNVLAAERGLSLSEAKALVLATPMQQIRDWVA